MKKLLLSLLIVIGSIAVKAQTADELFSKGDYAKAADAYDKLYKADTTSVTNARRLAFCYLQTDNAQHLARYYFQKALNNDPNDVASNYYLGVYFVDLEKKLPLEFKKEAKQNALKYLTKAADLGSEEAKADLKALRI